MSAGAVASIDSVHDDIVHRLDALFAPWARTDEPGLVVGIARDNALVYRRGFGMASLEHGLANTPATRMRIGSVSKHFTGLLALLLAEEGTFDLDTPIRTYIPELAGPGGLPTARQLLQHRGGSRCYLDLGFIVHGLSPPPLGWPLLTQARQVGRNFAPGDAMIYNNGGYHLVSIALERVGGAPFERQLKARLFDVIGMPATVSAPSDYDIIPGVATFHLPASDRNWRRGMIWTEELKGEGAIISTVDDMLRWMAHLRTRDQFGSPQSWSQLLERPRLPDGRLGSYALGLMLGKYRGLDMIHHTGSVSGGTSHMVLLPDAGVDIILMANGARDAMLPQLSQKIVDIVCADRVGALTSNLCPSDYASWLGDWWSDETGMVYSLGDQQGVLTLTTAMASVSGNVEARGESCIVEPAGTLGEVALTLLKDDVLEIRFGVSRSQYERLRPKATDAAQFAAQAVGTYFCADAAATAHIALADGGPAIRTSDGYGELIAPLVPLSNRVAYAKPEALHSRFHFTITLDLKEGRAEGFRLCTTRTRALEFRRSAPA